MLEVYFFFILMNLDAFEHFTEKNVASIIVAQEVLK